MKILLFGSAVAVLMSSAIQAHAEFANESAINVSARSAPGSTLVNGNDSRSAAGYVNRVVRVRTSDLDLASANGRELLDQRLVRAAEVACDKGYWKGDISDYRSCYVTALRGAERQASELAVRSTPGVAVE